jgi:hypothetical protein
MTLLFAFRCLQHSCFSGTIPIPISDPDFCSVFDRWRRVRESGVAVDFRPILKPRPDVQQSLPAGGATVVSPQFVLDAARHGRMPDVALFRAPSKKRNGMMHSLCDVLCQTRALRCFVASEKFTDEPPGSAGASPLRIAYGEVHRAASPCAGSIDPLLRAVETDLHF